MTKPSAMQAPKGNQIQHTHTFECRRRLLECLVFYTIQTQQPSLVVSLMTVLCRLFVTPTLCARFIEGCKI
jgi:hypothetical protein